MNSPLNQQYKGPKLAPTPVSDNKYTGVTLDAQKRGSLTSQGAFLPSSASACDTSNRGDVQAADSLTSLRNALGSCTLGNYYKNTSLNRMGQNKSTQARTNDSPFSSEADIHPSSGVPLNQSDSTMPTITLPQHANFSQLAEHQGIHDWNNSVFDDRWLLQPEEIWNLDIHRDSATTVSPRRLAPSRHTSRTGDQMRSSAEEPQRSSVQNVHTQRVIREAEEKEKDHGRRQMSTVPTEKRQKENNESVAASEKLTIGLKGNYMTK